MSLVKEASEASQYFPYLERIDFNIASSNNNNPTKMQTPPSSTTKHISTLPLDMLMTCIEYVEKGNYMSVASVSREFRDCYTDLHPGRETSAECVAAS